MRILLVEDDEEQARTISDSLKYKFPGVTLVLAASTHDAEVQIRRLSYENAQLHVAIVDINLPKKSGHSPSRNELEFGLSVLIRSHFESCRILYYTVCSDQKLVRDHIGIDPTHDRLIPKGRDGDKKLLEAIRQHWQLQLLAWAKEILWPKPHSAVSLGRPSGPASGPGCSTIQVNTLLHEIACFHDNFTKEGISEIEQYVEFIKVNGHWQAELLPWEAENGDAREGDNGFRTQR